MSDDELQGRAARAVSEYVRDAGATPDTLGLLLRAVALCIEERLGNDEAVDMTSTTAALMLARRIASEAVKTVARDQHPKEGADDGKSAAA
jgi:hypothetical protein